MFVFSVKTTKRQMITSAVCVAAMIVLAIAAAATSTPIKSTVGVPITDVQAGTDEQRIGYLSRLGYETVSEPTKIQEIRLPDEADPVLDEYNTLLQQAGMDLKPYYGKRVKCYSYRVLNHVDGDAAAHLYVYRDKIVAGHLETAKGQQLLAPQAKSE